MSKICKVCSWKTCLDNSIHINTKTAHCLEALHRAIKYTQRILSQFAGPHCTSLGWAGHFWYATAPETTPVNWSTWRHARRVCDFSAWCTTTFRQNGGKNYFRFEFRLQISTFRTRSPYMERIFRRLSASIRPSEFKRPTIAAFGLSNFADQATIWRFLPSCWAPNFATMLAMQTKLCTIVVFKW